MFRQVNKDRIFKVLKNLRFCNKHALAKQLPDLDIPLIIFSYGMTNNNHKFIKVFSIDLTIRLIHY